MPKKTFFLKNCFFDHTKQKSDLLGISVKYETLFCDIWYIGVKWALLMKVVIWLIQKYKSKVKMKWLQSMSKNDVIEFFSFHIEILKDSNCFVIYHIVVKILSLDHIISLTLIHFRTFLTSFRIYIFEIHIKWFLIFDNLFVNTCCI